MKTYQIEYRYILDYTTIASKAKLKVNAKNTIYAINLLIDHCYFNGKIITEIISVKPIKLTESK